MTGAFQLTLPSHTLCLLTFAEYDLNCVALLLQAHGEADGAGEGPADERMPMVAAVIGGHKYEAGKWPWLVSLQV